MILISLTVYVGDCVVSLNAKTFKLKQFHLHAPSEHTINGNSLSGEIHFVHVSGDGKALLVVGIFIEIGVKSDSWLGPVLDALEMVNSTAKSDAIVVDLYVDIAQTCTLADF